ncbi:SurA N-terminal domain-containing protein [Winogradskyella immobilis]|uniref:Periplasmic chaperone PpiD n=1 Tax=Winogradskyella immobilis TaxID=2816852 RepID=A0ABS8EJ10_9FLAO|nr:SurA N-terminal domain-containing protein [Winogradskyella immobilis]MCC1483179.1 SurA N-terminal domain-containing protein [Winogradskyella immobilis]MCG0015274.1 SurA N-terminal domain-containing protein [Winogradskyella immobilis]
MAVLNKIRQRSLVLILVIALALFSFVIGDLFKNSDALTGTPQDIIATVNGEDIKRDAFMFSVQNMQQRVGPTTTETQVKNSVYSNELRRIILNTELDKLGLSVEKDQMRELLKNSFESYPEFQNSDSIFDVNRLNAFISNLKDIQPESAPLGNLLVNYASWTDNEQSLANTAMTQSYYNLIKAGVGATIAEAEDEYEADAKTLDINYVQIPYTSIADSLVTVTKSEIEAYMKAHEDEYKVEATREILFVEFREDASKEDEDAIKEELLTLKNDKVEFNENTKKADTILGFDNTKNIEAFVNSYSDIKYADEFSRASQLGVAKDSLLNAEVGSYYGPYKDGIYYKYSKVLAKASLPDSVKVRHILIPYVGAQAAGPDIIQTADEAKVTADSIYNVVRRSRSKFKNLLELSSDKVSNENDGVIEFAYNQSFAPEFKSYSFDNKKGDMGVVETSFGYHIVEILDQTEFNNTAKVATIARKIEASEKTIDDVFNAKSKFEIAAETTEFNDLAKEKGLTVRTSTFKELEENIPGLGSQRQVVRWAFEDDIKVGDYKSFPISGVGFIVAKLVDINKEGLMSVENATTPVLVEVRKEKKAEMIRAKISASTLADIANNQGQTVRTAAALTEKNTTLSGAGIEPKVVGAAFGLAQGAISKPIDGERGVYILQVNKITEAPKLENYAAIIARLGNALKNTVQNKVYTALEAAAEIDDNRAKTVY